MTTRPLPLRPLLLLLPLCSLLLPGHPAAAATVAPPADLGGLARASAAVVYAEALESWGETAGDLPVTVTRFLQVEAVAEPAGAAAEDLGRVFEVVEPGGIAAGRGAVVAGAPRYRAGGRYLLFLAPAPGNRWRSRMLAHGLLEEVAGRDGAALLRPLPEAAEVVLVRPPVPGGIAGKAVEPEPVGVYRRDALLAHLREVARGARWDRMKAGVSPDVARAALAATSSADAPLEPAAAAAAAVPAVCAYITGSDGNFVRWFGYETGTDVTIWATLPGQVGVADGGVSAVTQGTAAWRNHADSVIRFDSAGLRPAGANCGDGSAIDINLPEVTFNDPCEELPDLVACGTGAICCGTLAFGGMFFDPTTTRSYDGAPWHPAISPFVVVNDGSQCVGEVNFKEMMTHELGHTQGFDHHTPPNPADATMSALLKKDGRGASIRSVDERCAVYAYHTFLDVPPAHFAWGFVEAIENAQVTGGCGSGNYCPDAVVTRGPMAVFLLRAKEGPSYTPPPCLVPTFSDVSCTDPLAPWIEELVRRGVTAGCGGGKFCPAGKVTREQIAVFLLATLEGPGYRPAACTVQRFNDVPCSSPYARWIHELVDRGVTAGCGNNNFCPTSQVSRAQMAVFVATTFGLPLPPAP